MQITKNKYIFAKNLRLNNNFKKLIGKMENKGYEMWKEWMIQDSILFDELIEANNKKGGNNGK